MHETACGGRWREGKDGEEEGLEGREESEWKHEGVRFEH